MKALALFALLVLTRPLAASASSLDLDAWLRRPGVKLLAVEFYATWCKPCMEAVPRWKALHERYRAQGLRLVVVATQDPQGGCVNPGWSPDEVVCDDEGRLAERFGASKLPAAFLWGWQGSLLTARGHVDDVEKAIEAWMQASPRLDVQGDPSAPSALVDLVRGQLQDQDKLVIVASAEEQRRLDEIRKRSYQAGYDEKLQCKLGEDLSPNSLLRVSLSGKAPRQRLQLHLSSAERGCLVAASVVDYQPDKAKTSVAEGVDELMRKLAHAAQVPWAGATAQSDPYGALADEAARAREAEKGKGDEGQRLEKAWQVVKGVAETAALPRERRTAALERFLADFAGENPRRAEAERLLAELKRGPLDVMVAIPAGRFWQGCNAKVDKDCGPREKPGRTASVRAFQIDRTEVTVAAYTRCVNAGACSAEGLREAFWEGKPQPKYTPYCNWGQAGREAHPINCLTQAEASAYCLYAGKRLPSEAEWERAARGTDGRKYPWGNQDLTPAVRVANVSDESAKRAGMGLFVAEGYDDGHVGTAPVASFPAGQSPEGLFDMVGNVSEWTGDLGAEGAAARGGSWDSIPGGARASQRAFHDPSVRYPDLGVRCAK